VGILARPHVPRHGLRGGDYYYWRLGQVCWHRFGSTHCSHTAESFDEAEKICLDTPYPYEDAKDPTDPNQCLRGSYLGYDTGYRTSEVYERWLARPAEIVLHKGWETLAEKWKPSNVEYYPNGKKNPHAIRVFHLNTGFFKEKVHGIFKRPGDGPGTLHFHRETSQAYLDQVTAEHYVYRKPKKGKGRG
jgi:hypothetical protein